MNTQNTIELHKSNGMWAATYGGPHAVEIQRLFGTTTLPTAFAASTHGYMVLNHIMAKNPGVRVIMPGDGDATVLS